MSGPLWSRLMRPLLFRFDAETVHERSMGWFSRLNRVPGGRALLSRITIPTDSALQVERFGLTFRSPIGLAAGFDKNARWIADLSALGFGSVEVGTLTPVGQPGNPQPRLFRLPADRAIINRLGFNNAGAEDAASRLTTWRRRHSGPADGSRVVLGVNIGKNKVTPNPSAADDYLKAFTTLAPFADYITVNVSSPNTAGLRDLQDPESLGTLLRVLQDRNEGLAAEHDRSPLPILLKIAPDLNEDGLPAIVEIAREYRLAGIVATNTTISRENLNTDPQTIGQIGAGGLSGAPLAERSRRFVHSLYELSGGTLPIVGVGGVMDVGSAWAMLSAGASLLQVYTGFVYGGPMFVASLHRGLLARMRQEGATSLENVIGRDHRASTDREALTDHEASAGQHTHSESPP